jgi:hypothetical protein
MIQFLRSNLIIVSAGLLLTGCHSTHAPTVDVLGSYFPSWIICIVIGLVLSVISRQIFITFKIAEHLRPAPLIYLCLTACFTMIVWLIFFKN